MAEEGLKKTKNDLIHIGCPIPFDIEEFLEQLDSLLEAAYKNKQKEIFGAYGNMINLRLTKMTIYIRYHLHLLIMIV